MRRIVPVTIAALVLAAASASAAPPKQITIIAVFDPITFGDQAFVNGQLQGSGQAGQTVTLEQAPAPFSDWTPSGLIATTNASGYYSFMFQPQQTMQYRATAQDVTSPPAQVSVAPRISFGAKALSGYQVRFAGQFAPALPGQAVAIQKLSVNGNWVTLTGATLHNGNAFLGRMTARHPLKLRAFYAGDATHLAAATPAVKVIPLPPRPKHKRAHKRGAKAAACTAPRVTRVSTYPDPPSAAKAFTLRVRAAMTAGKVYAIDVRWGVDGQRDHFVFAPQLRRARVTFALRHTYANAGAFRTTIRVYGAAGGCKTSGAVSRRLRVAA